MSHQSSPPTSRPLFFSSEMGFSNGFVYQNQVLQSNVGNISGESSNNCGTSLESLVKDYQGPFYVYNCKHIEARVELLQKALPQVSIHFAVKSNHNKEVLSVMSKKNVGVDVVSGGELKHAIQSGIPASKAVFSGVGKTREEIRFALKSGVFQINVESTQELERILVLAKEMNFVAPVALRVNPNVDVATHPYISTGLLENKFGIELEQLPVFAQIIKENPNNLNFVALSMHLGSQMTELGGFQQGLKCLVENFIELQKKFSSLKRLDIDGVLVIFYDQERPEEEKKLLAEYAQIVNKETSGVNCSLMSEPGRWLVAHSGVLISQVQYIKKSGSKKFVILDSGMNHLIRPTLYEGFHRIAPLRIYSDRQEQLYDIVGPICESSDFFAKDRKIMECRQDDFVAIFDVGAYGFSMASEYNLQTLPREICV